MELQSDIPLLDIITNFDRYVIIKQSKEFPLYLINQDIDILTDTLEKNINILVYLYDKNRFYHKIHNIRNGIHYHVDLYLKSKPNQLHFRFDMFSALQYKSFSLNQSIVKYIIDKRILSSSVYIPRIEDDLSIRYAEYIEYQSTPRKIKHLHYTNQFPNIDFYKVKQNDQNCCLNYHSGDETYFSFIVWSHGIKHLYDILELLKKSVYCKILLITKKHFHTINEFIDQVYALELHNKNHIKGKTNYLRTMSNEYVYILVKKYDYCEKKYGKLPNQIHADEDIVNFKWIIREKYNPKLTNATHQPSPSLPPGISHEHVLHATDTIDETSHLTKLITQKPISYYEDKSVNNAVIPYHINGSFRIHEYQIDELFMNIRVSENEVKKTLISESPHYQYIIGNKQAYIDYYNRFIGTFFTDDHLESSFDSLIENFNPFTYNQFENERFILVNKSNCVLDGNHRLAILCKNNIKVIKVLCLL